ncbi:L-erythro-3,5-diaminohexanoate dehydrogenase [Clostridiisalibacter paucivorans]|uniref:L-erythro-3,5-diaminohexanoate dehydrogenase n=1 Tax=Clostridiisalibacter paucivorans TaxID=408753 RepID=UPI00054E9D99|nr:L-erythro-3,5-diaminohexanoate dehydrogenase [Clostridiisalibacter paucivorans]
MKGNTYGGHRVLEPKGFLPQSAAKVNNTTKICSNEILIDVIALNPTSTAFNRIRTKCNGDKEEIKKSITEIVEAQGKFQDPVTKSGGNLIGKVKQIGQNFQGKSDLKVGDKIATLVSLSLTPLKIHEILDVNIKTDQVFVKADAVLFESGIYTKLPKDLSENLSLAIMDVAGAPAQVAVNAKPNDIVVVIGSGKAGLLCLHEAKKRVKPTGKVICIEYSKEQCELVKELGLADYVIQGNAQHPLEILQKYQKIMGDRLADLTINTVNVSDTEVSTVLITDNEGLVYFFSMSTNFAKASLGAEGIGKYTRMLVGNGYYPGHADVTFQIMRDNPMLRNYFEKKYLK